MIYLLCLLLKESDLLGNHCQFAAGRGTGELVGLIEERRYFLFSKIKSIFFILRSEFVMPAPRGRTGSSCPTCPGPPGRSHWGWGCVQPGSLENYDNRVNKSIL